MRTVTSLKDLVSKRGKVAFNCGHSDYSVLRSDGFEAIRWPGGPDCKTRAPVAYDGQSGAASCESKSGPSQISFEASLTRIGEDVMTGRIKCGLAYPDAHPIEETYTGVWMLEPFGQFGLTAAWSSARERPLPAAPAPLNAVTSRSPAGQIHALRVGHTAAPTRSTDELE